MSRSVISRFEKLSTTLDRILDRERRECFAVGREDRHRGVDAVRAHDVDGDVRAFGSCGAGDKTMC